MRRTQIYLDPEMSETLERLARKRRTTKAGLIRLATERFLDQETGGDDPILGVVGLGSSEHQRTSEEHDRVLAEHELSHWSR